MKYTTAKSKEIISQIINNESLQRLVNASRLLIALSDPYVGQGEKYAEDPRRVFSLTGREVGEIYNVFIKRIGCIINGDRFGCHEGTRIVLAVLNYAEETLEEIRCFLQFVARDHEDVPYIKEGAWTDEVEYKLYYAAQELLNTLGFTGFFFTKREAAQNKLRKIIYNDLLYYGCGIRHAVNDYLALYDDPKTKED